MRPRFCWVQLSLLVLTAATCYPQIDNRANLGMNLWFHTDYNNSLAFTDIVRRARSWGSVARPDLSTGVRVDQLGWPMQDAGLFLHTSLEGNARGQTVPGPAPLPVGIYKIVFAGQAEFIRPSSGTVRNKKYDPKTNTTRADWELKSTDQRHDNISIAFTGTRRLANSGQNSGLTNLRIYLPGFPDNGSVTFTPSFLNLVRQFGIIRFMDWIDANKNPLQKFANRVTPAHASYNLSVGSADFADLDAVTDPKRGVAIEHMIQLCNETDTDMWLNIPALADDDCVRRMLLLVRDGTTGFGKLEAERKLYLEYGNEVWNSFAPAAGFLCFLRASALARDALQAERATGKRHPINFDKIFDGLNPAILTRASETLTPREREVAATIRHRFVAFRIKTISDIARSVFGDGQMMTRIRPILASQFGDAQLTFSTGLRFLDECFGVVRTAAPANSVARRVDQIIFGGGGAPYALGDIRSRDAYFRTFPHAEFRPATRIDAILARGYGIRCVAYEAGTSLGDPVTGAGVLDAVTERTFNNDPRMFKAQADAHRAWLQAGGDTAVYLTLTGDPTFEFARNDQDSASPKLRAYDNMRREALPAVSTGQLVPSKTAFFAGHVPHFYDDGAAVINGGQSVLIDARSFAGRAQLLLPLRTAGRSAVNVTISVETSAVNRGASSLQVLLNGRLLGTVSVPANSVATFQLAGAQGAAQLQGGLNVLTLRAATGQTEVRRVRVVGR